VFESCTGGDASPSPTTLLAMEVLRVGQTGEVADRVEG